MKKHKVLIVDDDPLNVKLLSAMLGTEHYEKMEAHSGLEALAAVMKNAPDLILMDIMMPGLDGFAVTEKLKNDPNTEAIPVVLVTALDGMESKIKGLACGADELINKPIHVAELKARIASLMQMKDVMDALKTRDADQSRIFPEKNLNDPANEPPGILIVEDNEKDAKLILSYLHDEKYRLNAVSTGEEGISRVCEEKIDVVLLDMLLPGMDGFKVCKILKTAEFSRNIQIIGLTCLTDLDSRLKGITLGADDFLVKPIHRYELKMRIKALIKKKSYLDRLSSAALGK